MSHINSLPRAILDFEQCKKESIGVAWARFSKLIYAGPDLSLPDGVILCLFCLGIDIDADLCLDVTAEGRSTHKPMTEQVKFLKNFLKSTLPSSWKLEPSRQKSCRVLRSPHLSKPNSYYP